MDKEGLVSAALPASLLDAAPAGKHPDRLDMARWWVSESNPLTARVFVNRLWEQLFGIGIVSTLEDFGSAGEKPTHPELLDHLAVRFQKDHQWSVKKILREIVLSHAYRQSSRITESLLERDPDNRWLARGPRLRLTAEQVRDQALALSGLLSDKRGGPPVHPPLPPDVWRPFEAKDKWTTPKPGEEDRYRRSIYTYVKRSIPYPTFATFDAPSREVLQSAPPHLEHPASGARHAQRSGLCGMRRRPGKTDGERIFRFARRAPGHGPPAGDRAKRRHGATRRTTDAVSKNLCGISRYCVDRGRAGSSQPRRGAYLLIGTSNHWQP